MSPRSPRQRAIRRAVVATVGSTLLIAGVLMLVLPGPGVVVILAALTLLASEFHWARRLKRKVVVWLRKRTKKRAEQRAEQRAEKRAETRAEKSAEPGADKPINPADNPVT